MGSSGDPQKANQLKSSLDYLDQYLEIEEYVAGDNLTIADLAILATVTHLEGVEWSYKSYENIFRWVTKLKTELPYYNECNQGGINMFKDWVKLRREQAAATAAEEAAKSVRQNSRT